MKKTFLPTSLLAMASLVILAGCETTAGGAPTGEVAKPTAGVAARPVTGGQNVTPAAPVAPVASPEQVALKEGIDLYNKGDFNDAIKRLGSPDITAGTKAGQLTALKYMAFSYCVTNRTTLCRQNFEKAFKLDPTFDLAAGEHGHPLWGKVFLRAKASTNPAKK